MQGSPQAFLTRNSSPSSTSAVAVTEMKPLLTATLDGPSTGTPQESNRTRRILHALIALKQVPVAIT